MGVGYLFALTTILLFGSWAVPAKNLRVPPRVLAFWLTVGHLLLSLYLFFYLPSSISLSQSVMPFIAGVLWAVGITAGFMGIKELGITRAIGTWIPIVIITSALWGFLFFGEALLMGTTRFVISFGAILILVAAALSIVLSSKEDKKTVGNIKLGLLGSVILGITHGSFFVPLRASTLGVTANFVPLTIGMVVTMLVIISISREKVFYKMDSILRMLSGGLLLGGGNYTAILTTIYLGVAQGYPLTQLAIIVNSLWGVFVFKEVTTPKGKLMILLGVTLALIGAFILNQTRISQ